MAKYRWKPARFAFYDRERIESILESMAQKGWILEKIGGYAWKYRAAEPKERKVAVLYVADASEFRPDPTENQELLRELGEADGWTLQVSWGQMQIYYSDNPEAVSMETDPVTQVESIRRAMKKDLLPVMGMNLLFALLWLGMLVWQLRTTPVYVLSTTVYLILLMAVAVYFLVALLDLVFPLLWYRKARAAAEEGQPGSFRSPKGSTWIFKAAVLGLLAAAILCSFEHPALGLLAALPLPLTWGIMGLLRDKLKKRGVSRWANVIATLCVGTAALTVMQVGISGLAVLEERPPVDTFEIFGREREVYKDDLPLELEDLQDTGDMAYSKERTGQESVLVSCYRYDQWPLTQYSGHDDLDYTVTEVHWSPVYDLCKGEVLRNRDEVQDGKVLLADHYEAIDPGPWEADEAWQQYWGDGFRKSYVLCYGSTLVKIHLPWEPSSLQMQTIAEIFRIPQA